MDAHPYEIQPTNSHQVQSTNSPQIQSTNSPQIQSTNSPQVQPDNSPFSQIIHQVQLPHSGISYQVQPTNNDNSETGELFIIELHMQLCEMCPY